MMQNTPPILNISPLLDDPSRADLDDFSHERSATVWVSRITGIVGTLTLLVALFVWLARPGHYRLVLAFLTIAMFCAILHSYMFENGQA